MTSVYDLIRAVALATCYVFLSRQDRKTWMWGESVLLGVYAAVMFLCPGCLFPGNESPLVFFLVRLFASGLFSYQVMGYLSRNTRDESVVGAILWSRLMGFLLMLAVLLYAYFTSSDKFPEKMLYFEVFGVGMMVLSTMYQFWRGRYRVGGREQKDHVSTVFHIFFLILFFGGLVDLTFPSWLLPVKKLAITEKVIVQAAGAGCIGQSFMAWYGTSFRYDEDKKAYFLALLMSSVLSFIGLNIAYFKDGVFSPQDTLKMHAWFLPSLLILAGIQLMDRKGNSSQTTYYTRSKAL